MKADNGFLYEDLSKRIIGCFYKVHDQLINYLKATGIKVGLLVNFGERMEFKRRVF